MVLIKLRWRQVIYTKFADLLSVWYSSPVKSTKYNEEKVVDHCSVSVSTCLSEPRRHGRLPNNWRKVERMQVIHLMTSIVTSIDEELVVPNNTNMHWPRTRYIICPPSPSIQHFIPRAAASNPATFLPIRWSDHSSYGEHRTWRDQMRPGYLTLSGTDSKNGRWRNKLQNSSVYNKQTRASLGRKCHDRFSWHRVF